MAVRFSEEQVLEATRGTRVRFGARAAYDAVCTDTRALTPGCLFVALQGERFDGHEFLFQASEGGAAGVVVKQGHPRKDPGPDVAVYEVSDTLHALGGLGRAHRERFKIPVGAVTGSNGKTTTKELVGAILETQGPALKTSGNLNNEIGVPLTLFGLEPKHRTAIIEMGMNHAGEIDRLARIAKPTAGLITVVQPAHLEGVGSIEGVAQAKGELFEALQPGAVAVVNADDARVAAQASRLQTGVASLWFGRSERAEVRLLDAKPSGLDGQTLSLSVRGRAVRVKLALLGAHNALNATGAFALGLALGVSVEDCVKGLESAHAHDRRLQVREGLNGVTVVDDCYNANPASMEAALDTLQGLAKQQGGRAVAVLGDMLELGADELALHQGIGAKAKGQVALAALFGPRMAKAHQAMAGGPEAAHFTEVEPLMAWLQPKLSPKDVVLVKASRGMKLERVVQALTGTKGGGAH